MQKHVVLLVSLGALCVLACLSCGHVTLGNFNPAPAFIDQEMYRADEDPQLRAYHRSSRSTLTSEQDKLYRELADELSKTLAMYRTVGATDYRNAWPSADSQRVEQLQVAYDYSNQLLTWNYENLGDYDLDGMVNTTDLLPVVVFSGFAGGASGVLPSGVEVDAVRKWIDSDNDGQLGYYNARLIGQSYGRAVFGYAVFAGQSDNLAAMDPIGVVKYDNRLPGFPPRFEFHVPSGYPYICLQPLGPRNLPVCNYMINMLDKRLPITVQQPQ
jgi:hypothetical protein